MKKETLLFDLSIIVFTPVEYAGLYLFVAYVLTDNNHLSALMTTVAVFLLGVILFFLNRYGHLPEKSKDSKAKQTYLDAYGKDIKTISKQKGHPIELAVVNVTHLLPAAAFYHRGTIYINKKTHIHPDYLRAIIYHELGHAMSKVSDHAHFLALRPFYLFGKYMAMASRLMINHTKKTPRFLKRFIKGLGYAMAYVPNLWSFLSVYPFFRHEEHMANKFAVMQGQGETLRTYYRMNGPIDKKALFDFEHPTRQAMIEKINAWMGKTTQLDKDVYVLNDRIKRVDNVKSTEKKHKKIIRWLSRHVDERPAWAYQLARRFEFALGTDKNIQMAKHYYHKAAKDDRADAHYRLALLEEKTTDAYRHHLEEAAKQDHTKASIRLAEHLITENTNDEDPAQARDLLDNARKKHDPVAKRMLSLINTTYHLSSTIKDGEKQRLDDPSMHSLSFNDDFLCEETTETDVRQYTFFVKNRHVHLYDQDKKPVKKLRLRANQLILETADPSSEKPDDKWRLIFTRDR